MRKLTDHGREPGVPEPEGLSDLGLCLLLALGKKKKKTHTLTNKTPAFWKSQQKVRFH